MTALAPEWLFRKHHGCDWETKPQTSRRIQRKDPSTSTSGWVTAGPFSSHIPLTLLQFAQPNWEWWRA
jgi:hypothetical protein